MFKYEVIDDFIPSYHQDCIERELSSISWTYNKNISGTGYSPTLDNDLVMSESQAGFAGNIFSTDTTKNNDVLLGLCLPIIAKAASIIPDSVRLDRIRAGMFLKGSGLHTPHVDYFFDHYTVLYYANDSDGDTHIFNEYLTLSDGIPVHPDNFTLMDRVSPKRGRVIIFNGLIYHSSSSPIDSDERLAININLTKKT